MVIKEMVHITPYHLERMLHIYLPDDYEESEARYPVMYMYDGHNLFYNEDATYGKSWGLQEFMRQWENQLIIVGIECNHEGNKRLRSFRPMISRILTDKGFMERAKSLCSGWSMS